MHRFAAPLFATGCEFLFHEQPFAQGNTSCKTRSLIHDVPTFFKHAHQRVAELSEGSVNTSQESNMAGIRHIFDPCTLGKYNSLNMNKLFQYGTLEFRRQHMCHDEYFIVAWAHFCVVFVEVFSATHHASAFLDVPTTDGLAELQRAQRTATYDELAGLLEGHIDSDIMECLCQARCTDMPAPL